MSNDASDIKARLEYLRGEIEAERISYGEIVELQSLAAHIDPSDVLLLQWAGVEENGATKRIYALMSSQGTACAETVLSEDEYNAENREQMEEIARADTSRDRPIPGTWTDVSDNEACREELNA